MRLPLRPAAAALAGLLTGALLTVAPAPAQAANRVTPGDITGYGFDQCVAPEQWKMDRWMETSPYLAVGIYISGASRGCRSQPNLTPTWVSNQLANGWRLLPITLGPQASCSGSFPRYGNDPTIDPRPGANGKYAAARLQGQREADSAVAAAQALGIAPDSTLWYDLEAFDATNTRCRESALGFLSGWTWKVRTLGFKSGVYSSASSGIKALDDARRERPGVYTLPDAIWIARWDGVPNTSTTYIPEDGWRPGGRMKQYRGGHNETHGGVTINIDSNYLDLGRGSRPGRSLRACGGVKVDYWKYDQISPGTRSPAKIRALQCLLRQKKFFGGDINGRYTRKTRKAVMSFQAARRQPVTTTWSTSNWMRLHAEGKWTVVKIGSTGPQVRRVQRALNAAGVAQLMVNGHFDTTVDQAVRTWQRQVRLPVTGVIAPNSWQALVSGRR
ncbi:glycoside hydrolase domain-containing protein [Nocardioides pacificus]